MISFAKKFLSIALALVLLVGVFPATAFATVPQTSTFNVSVKAKIVSIKNGESVVNDTLYTVTAPQDGHPSASDLQALVDSKIVPAPAICRLW